MYKLLQDVSEGQFLISVQEAIKLESELVTDPKGNGAVSASEVQKYIEDNSIKALAIDGTGKLYYDALALKVSPDQLN